MLRAVAQIAAFSAGYFLVALAVAFTAFGMDMDQLRSRSLLSRVAAMLNDVLWFPHDSFMRALPNHWIVVYPYLIPGALAANCLLWGVALYLAWNCRDWGLGTRGRGHPRLGW